MEEETKKINEILGPHFPCGKKFKFSARADLITEKHIWELKCTSTISIEHRLQLVIYDWLWRALHSENSLKHPHKKYIRKPSKMKTAKIVNIKTGEMLRIDASFDELTQIVVALLKGKYITYEEKTDEEFISHCLQYLHTKQASPQ